VSGVHLHAGAVNAVATGHVTKTVPQSIMFGLVAVLALGTCTLGLRVSPWMFMVGTGGIMFGLGLGATIALGYDIWLPIALPILSVLFIALFVYGIRYVVEERIKGALKAELMFLGGLPRWIIERMAEGEFHLTPENQSCDVTVMFADLSGFTEMSTLVSSEVLATTTSKYFAVIVQQVEATGGWVSEFRGDCVMAIWGGMVSDPNHALHGVQAACRAAWQVDRLKENAEQRGEMGFGIKIGVNSGPAVFGKIGALKRGTYTASGETINLAARLEHLPKVYNCLVVLGPSTAQLVKDDFVIRELDTLKVKGMAHPITIFEALSDCPAMPNQKELIERYDLALTHYRAGRFTQACEIWTTLAESPLEHIRFGNNHTVLWNPSTIMAKRAQEKLLRPPSGS